MKRSFLILLSFFILAGCQPRPVTGRSVNVPGGSYKDISPVELRAMLENKDFVFINVHIPFAGNIRGTDLSIPYDQVESHLAELPSDKNAGIVLYCRSGRMSAIAAEKLISLGYSNVWNLEGGMAAWEQAGFEIEK